MMKLFSYSLLDGRCCRERGLGGELQFRVVVVVVVVVVVMIVYKR